MVRNRVHNINASKLTLEDCKNIQKMYKEGYYKIVPLSKMYRTSTKRITKIIDGDNDVGGWTERKRDIAVTGGGEEPLLTPKKEASENKEEEINGLSALLAEAEADAVLLKEKRKKRLIFSGVPPPLPATVG